MTTTNGRSSGHKVVAPSPPADPRIINDITAASVLCDLLNRVEGQPGRFDVDGEDGTTLNYLDQDGHLALRIRVSIADWLSVGGMALILVSRADVYEPDIDGALRRIDHPGDTVIYSGPWITDAAPAVWRSLPEQVRAWARTLQERDAVRREIAAGADLRARVLDQVPRARIASFRRDLLQGMTPAGSIAWTLEAGRQHLFLTINAPHDAMETLVGIARQLMTRDSGQPCRLCGQPAQHDILTDDGIEHLCDACHRAFKHGQHNYGLRTADLGGMALCARCSTLILLDEDEFHHDPDTGHFYCRICSAHITPRRRSTSVLDLRCSGGSEEAPDGMSPAQHDESRTEQLEPA